MSCAFSLHFCNCKKAPAHFCLGRSLFALYSALNFTRLERMAGKHFEHRFSVFQKRVGSTLSFSVIALRTRQGFPAAITPAGISRVTTLPAPMMLPAPMVTPPQIVAFAPIQTSSSSVMGAEVPATRYAASTECPEHAMQTPGAINALAPMWTGEASRITQL